MNTDIEADVTIYNEGWSNGYRSALEKVMLFITEQLGENAKEHLELCLAIVEVNTEENQE